MSDLIDRVAVLEDLEKRMTDDYVDAARFAEYVRTLPSAEPERKKGKWIDGLENGEWYIIECFTESGRFIAHDRYTDDTVFKAIDMGNMWQAYRKERE